jgi:hypothetical protein
VELLGGIYRVTKPALAAACRRHLARPNPLADHPTRRYLVALPAEEDEMIAWGEAALRALLPSW